MFRKSLKITNDTELTLRESWKVQIHILYANNHIDSSWNMAIYITMNSAWRKLWLECVPDRDLDGFEADSVYAKHSNNKNDDPTIIDGIATMGQSMGLEEDADDIEELLEDHSIELTTQELEHLQNEPEEKLTDKIEEKEEDTEDVSCAPIKEMISKWIDLPNFAEEHRTDMVITDRTVNIFNENVMAYFRKILKHRQRLQTLDKFLLKRRTTPNKFHLSQRDR